jgi:hypothetical protein
MWPLPNSARAQSALQLKMNSGIEQSVSCFMIFVIFVTSCGNSSGSLLVFRIESPPRAAITMAISESYL